MAITSKMHRLKRWKKQCTDAAEDPADTWMPLESMPLESQPRGYASVASAGINSRLHIT
jgi:hypothetical protein